MHLSKKYSLSIIFVTNMIPSFYLFHHHQLKLPLLYHAMEMWSVKMTSAGNPPFVAELAMRKVDNK